MRALLALLVAALLFAVALAECSCGINDCSCCEHIRFKVLGHKNDIPACSDIAFDWNTETVTLSLTLDGTAFESRSYTLNEKIEYCVNFLSGEYCVGPHNFLIEGNCFSGELDLDVTFLGIHAGTFTLGAFAIGAGCNH